MIGLWAIDMGASLKNLQNGNVVAESLLFTNVEPRVIYHAGIILIVGAFMSSVASCLIIWGRK